jgi:hypothetical protein
LRIEIIQSMNRSCYIKKYNVINTICLSDTQRFSESERAS